VEATSSCPELTPDIQQVTNEEFRVDSPRRRFLTKTAFIVTDWPSGKEIIHYKCLDLILDFCETRLYQVWLE
jgi:hypothetical protein